MAAAGLIVALAAPAAYSMSTAAQPHSGAIPSVGPASAGRLGFGGGRPGGGGNFGTNRQFGNGQGQAPGGFPFGGTNGNGQGNANGQGTTGGPGNFANPGGQGGRGGIGSLLNGSTPSSQLVALLKQGASGYRWTAAAVGSNSAAGVQLAAGEPIMAIGGFNGTDPTPTLAQFKQYVAQGKIHYFIGGSGLGSGQGGSSTSSQITSWVQQTFKSTTVGGTTVYDLTTTA